MSLPFRTKHPPYCSWNKDQTPYKSKIFSVIVACLYVLAFQDFPKWNIFCYCSLFKDQTPYKSKIFSVIVACSYVLTFQGHNTLPKWNILCYCSLFICIDLSRPQHPPKVKYSHCTPFSQSEIFFSNLLLEIQYFLKYFFKAVIVPWSLLVCMYWPSRTITPSQSEIFLH